MLENLGNVGDFLGGIGVVVTLIYLAIQIRQNTKQLRKDAEIRNISSLDEMNRALADWQSDVLINREIAELWLQGLRGETPLDDADRLRFEYIGARLLQIWQGNFIRYQLTEDAKNWSMNIRFVELYLASPGFASYWQRTKQLYIQDFRNEMDRIYAELPTS